MCRGDLDRPHGAIKTVHYTNRTVSTMCSGRITSAHMRQDVILRLRSQATFAQDDDLLVEIFGFAFKVHAVTHHPATFGNG